MAFNRVGVPSCGFQRWSLSLRLHQSTLHLPPNVLEAFVEAPFLNGVASRNGKALTLLWKRRHLWKRFGHIYSL